MQMDSASAGNALFGVGFTDYPAAAISPGHVQQLFTEVGRALARNVGATDAKLVPAKLGKIDASGVHAEGGGESQRLVLDARLAVDGTRLFQVVVIHEAADKTIDEDALEIYFASFRAEPKRRAA